MGTARVHDNNNNINYSTFKAFKMKIIKLQPIKEWEEKERDKPTGNIRIYVGTIHVGTCHRKNKLEELYSFHSLYHNITFGMLSSEWRQLEDIKTDVEHHWKEFAVKFIHSVQNLVKKPTNSEKLKAAINVVNNSILYKK